MRIAMIGTRGVPARYGGFETAIDEIGSRLAARGHHITVYCRRPEGEHGPAPTEHAGMKLVHLPALRKRSLETLSHTALSTAHAITQRFDAAFVFNSANAPFVPLLRARGIPVATHVDGLEWRRTKWSGAGKTYYRVAEQLSVRWSDALIADARGISDYYRDEFGAPTRIIAYGAPLLADQQCERLAELGLERGGYHLVVARFEPENHVHVIMEGYARSGAQLPLVVVGSAPYSGEYTAALEALAGSNVRMLGGVWDSELLDQLYAGARTYLHGHSVGGTNPSLLRAIGAGAATLAFDVVFNREVLAGSGWFFRSPDDVAGLVQRAEREPGACAELGEGAAARARDYDWSNVATAYEQLAGDLAAGRCAGPRPSGKRRGHPDWQ